MKIQTLLVLTILAGSAMRASAASNPLSVAVFDFESKDEAVKELGPKVSALLNVYLSTADHLLLVERAELSKALGEQELSLSGTVSGDSAARIGHLTGAKVLVTGRVFKVEKDLMITSKIIGTETSLVYGEMVKGDPTRSLDSLASELAEKIANRVASKADTLAARVLTREDRVESLKKALKEEPRPRVSVRIPETHFGGAVADPAAETELSLILQQCGFSLVDESSAEAPEFEISGEAFSAFGTRRGNLNACKGRVEIKVRRKADGSLVAVDRQTSVAVDIAEQIAAKQALQEAAAELASRVIPKLIAAK